MQTLDLRELWFTIYRPVRLQVYLIINVFGSNASISLHGNIHQGKVAWEIRTFDICVQAYIAMLKLAHTY